MALDSVRDVEAALATQLIRSERDRTLERSRLTTLATEVARVDGRRHWSRRRQRWRAAGSSKNDSFLLAR
jgi:hypothetical protein